MIIPLFLSILLVTLSFPTAFGDLVLPEMGFLIWIALVPAFVAMMRKNWHHAGRYGAALAFGYYLLSMYWLFFAMKNFGGLSATLSVLVLMLLALILAAYAGFAFFSASFLYRRYAVPVGLTLPFFWMLSEWLRERMPFNGYPWSAFAYALGYSPRLMQNADVFSVIGLSAFILMVNFFIARAWCAGDQLASIDCNRAAWRSRLKIRLSSSALKLALALFACLYLSGFILLRSVDECVTRVMKNREPLRTALIQGNIPQDEKWNPVSSNQVRTLYRELSLRAFEGGAQVVIWPETAYPYDTPRTLKEWPWMKNWLDEGKHLVMGGLTSEPAPAGRRLWNSALYLANGGQVVDVVDKVHLVPFGEYVPYRKLFFFARGLAETIGAIDPGERVKPLQTAFGPWGVLICYEDLFPDITRTLSEQNIELLLNLTNDAWYEKSSAAIQHVVYSQYRAIEARRFLLRATNTGVTAVIDPAGRVLDRLPWFERGILYSEVWPIKRGEITPFSLSWVRVLVFVSMFFAILGCMGKNYRYRRNKR